MIYYLSGSQYQCKVKEQKARHTINNVSMKDLSKIIKEFEKLPYKGNVRNRPKHEPTDSYFNLLVQIAKCIMRADDFNFHVYHVRMEITGMKQIPISHVFDSYKSE